LNSLEIWPYTVVEYVVAQARHYILRAMYGYGTVEHREGFGDIYRQRRYVIAMRMGDDDVAHAPVLFRRKGEAQAAAVNGNSLVDQETGQALVLRIAPGPAWQKSDPHEYSLHLLRDK
jgi:hypothetical protein